MESVEYWIDEFNGLHELYEAKKQEIKQLKEELNEDRKIMSGFNNEIMIMMDGLEKIANQDFRGNRCSCSGMAQEILDKVKAK